jgi:endonuclease III
MPEPAVSAQKSFSRFFEPRKKRPRDAAEEGQQEASTCTGREFSSGTAADPLILEESCDDDSESKQGAELQPSEQCKGPTELELEHEELTNSSKIKDTIHDPVDSANENPFACFAHTKSDATTPRETNPPRWRISNLAVSQDKPAKKAKTSSDKKQEPFVSVQELPAEEKLRITKKWHSMADKTAPVEVRRFQVLVAARLHARCQEPTVRKAMKSLRDNLDEFTAESVAKVDPEILALCITNLQFYNSKAKQIVKAANEILSQFNGQVPEDVNCLLQITGIGKVFADLLAFVNTRKAHATEIDDSTNCGL